MGLADMLLSAHGGGAAELLAQRFGISPPSAGGTLGSLLGGGEVSSRAGALLGILGRLMG